MEDELFLKLKSTYVITIHPHTNRDIIIIDVKEEQVILKIPAEKLLSQYVPDFTSVSQSYMPFNQLQKTIEGQFLLKIWKSHPDLFQTTSLSSNELYNDWREAEVKNSIHIPYLFATYEQKKKRKKMSIVLWGINELTDTLLQSTKKLAIKTYIVHQVESETNMETMRFLILQHYTSINEYKKRIELLENVVFITSAHELKEREQSTLYHIVDHQYVEDGLFSPTDWKADYVHYYGFYTNEFVVGPLVVKEESMGIESFNQKFQRKRALSTTPHVFITCGFIQRTLYYILQDTLPFLAADAQLPMNQVFIFDRASLQSSVIDIEVGIRIKREEVGR